MPIFLYKTIVLIIDKEIYLEKAKQKNKEKKTSKTLKFGKNNVK